jgi:phosphomannomutase
MVSVSGFRGRVGQTLTPELVAGLAAAFGAYVRSTGHGDSVCLGRDSRTSGPMLARAASAGLQSVGCRVIDLGMVATPTLLMAVRHHGAAGGIGVTASHNPAEWNALKLAGHDGLFLDGEASARFRASLHDRDPARAPWDRLGEVVEDPGATERHLGAILALDLLDVSRLRARSVEVALDCVHGAGGAVMPALLERLGCRVHAIGTQTDGRFPRDPEPTAAHLADLGRLVRETGADLGMAVDPDVDRLSLVDETGQPMGEDMTLALAAAAVLARRRGTVVTNLSTSQVVDDVARAAGARVVRAPVGEIHVARRMQAEKAVVGGEGNGGVILPDLHHTRDAPLAAALVLQHLADQGVTASAAVGRWPRYVIMKEKLDFPREALSDAYQALEEDLRADERDSTDGLRLAWNARRAWLHVRPSGTEPVVRLIAETPDEKSARELIARAAACLAGVAA